jgi:hypothetical protein
MDQVPESLLHDGKIEDSPKILRRAADQQKNSASLLIKTSVIVAIFWFMGCATFGVGFYLGIKVEEGRAKHQPEVKVEPKIEVKVPEQKTPKIVVDASSMKPPNVYLTTKGDKLDQKRVEVLIKDAIKEAKLPPEETLQDTKVRELEKEIRKLKDALSQKEFEKEILTPKNTVAAKKPEVKKKEEPKPPKGLLPPARGTKAWDEWIKVYGKKGIPEKKKSQNSP